MTNRSTETAERSSAEGPDILDQLAGIEPGTPLDALRRQRSDVRQYAEGSFRALLEPAELAGVSYGERELIALRVAVLSGSAPVAEQHRVRLRQLDVAAEIVAATEAVPAAGELPERLALILQHVDLLTLEPRSASRSDIQKLQAAGLSSRDIVTISQLIAFVTFQVRVLAGLRALGEAQ